LSTRTKIHDYAFAIMAIGKGLDSLIINSLDKMMMASLITAETLTGRDDYCVKYLKAFRNKQFEFSE